MAAGLQHESGGPALEHGEPPRDETLQHPRCVYQILKRHYARYTPEVVEEVCGVPKEQFLDVANAWAAASGRDRTAAVVYAVGWTQHTVGVQFIRTAAIIQLLLGNMGRPGGGIMAMRGHASIQGCTDVPTLFNLLPGYLAMPTAAKCSSLDTWISSLRGENQKGFWRNADTYAISLLKEYFGDNATPENDYCYDHLPRLTGDHGTYRTTMDMIDGLVKGYFLLGQNPAVGSVHGRLQRLAMANLDWLVVRDLAMIESATFWKDAPEVESGEIVTDRLPDRGVLLPGRLARGEGRHVHQHAAAAAVAGEGRRAVRRPALRAVVLLPPRPDDQGPAGRLDRPAGPVGAGPQLGVRDQRRTGPRGRAVGRSRCSRRSTGTARTGCSPATPTSRPTGRPRAAAGSTPACTRRASTRPARRKPRDQQESAYLEWGWAWPMDRRVLYNRASADPDGKPWSSARSTSGGTRAGQVGRPGRARTSRRPSRRRTGRRRARRARRRCAATTRSSCRPTARAGCSCRTGCRTGRCRPTTSRTSRRSATRSTASRATRPARSTAATTTRPTRRRPSRTVTSSRTCCSPRG